WIHRADYCRAGLRMLPSVDFDGGMTGLQMVCYCLALVTASLTPLVVGGAGPVYLAGALVLGIGFLVCAVGFAWRRSGARARAVLRALLLYLPALLILLVVERVPH